MKLQCMIDLETLSTRSNAVILSIGATKFDLTGIKDRFYVNVDAESCKKLNMHVSKATLEWWGKQSKEAIAHLSKNKKSIQEALSLFDKWFGMKSMPIWSNGASFDLVVMDNAYQVAKNEPTPWKYWDERCYRTVKALFDLVPEAEFTGTKHNSLADAEHQTNHLIKILNS